MLAAFSRGTARRSGPSLRSFRERLDHGIHLGVREFRIQRQAQHLGGQPLADLEAGTPEVGIARVLMNRAWIVDKCLDTALRKPAAQRLPLSRPDHVEVVDVPKAVRDELMLEPELVVPSGNRPPPVVSLLEPA